MNRKSFHNAVARYLFTLGRERALPSGLARVGVRTGGPLVGSLAQSALALIVVVIFALVHGDPILKLFTWLSGIRLSRMRVPWTRGATSGALLLILGARAAIVPFIGPAGRRA